jgi:hypothetical protein
MTNLTSAYLRQKRKRLLQRLHALDASFLRGSIIETYKRCGKPTCKCQKGRGHGPKYYLSVSFPGRKPEMIYIPGKMKDKVQSYVDNHRTMKAIQEEISEINRELIARRDTF